MDTALWLLALPSAAALGLLVAHAALNQGGRAVAAYFGALTLYGLCRGWAIRWITSAGLGTAFPYLMGRPLLQVGGVSLQELLGWGLAVTLAGRLGERGLARLGLAAAPHRRAAAAAAVLAVTCLAVESAAIAAGWWTWTLVMPAGGLRVPTVALLDWSFVAFDFLLPYLLWTSPATLANRLLASGFFALHMLGHLWLAPLPEPLPVAGNDLVHVGLLAYVLWRAAGESDVAPLESRPGERLGWGPGAAAAVVATSALLAHALARDARGAWTALPLLLLTLATWRAHPRAERPRWRAGSAVVRAGVVAAALAVLAFVRAPETRRQQAFVARLQRGTAALNRGALAEAEAELRAAVAQRPENAGGRTLLALALLGAGRRDAAREELETALVHQPTARDALLLAIQLDLADGQRQRAEARARLGARAHPQQIEFPYLASVARGEAGSGRPAAAAVVDAARRRGAPALGALAGLARALGDEATASACRDELAAAARR